MLLIILFMKIVLCFSKLFDYDNVMVLTSKQENNYFGYSILLQSGAHPVAIVGAPKSFNSAHNSTTGTLYRCTLNNNCAEYMFRTYDGVPLTRGNGEFMGATIVGESSYGGRFFTCAPRYTVVSSNNYYMRGLCFHVMNSAISWIEAERIQPTSTYADINIIGFQPYYQSAFAQAGFDIKFSNETNEVLTGAPGMVVWTGALITTTLTGSRKNQASSLKYNPSDQSYFGYTVAIGRFLENRTRIWYIGGSPRGADLKGKVVLFEKFLNNFVLSKELIGEEIGSYFGASLLILPKIEGDDLFVGAPMYAGNTWDEGCVYYYRNVKGTFSDPIKLFGEQQTGGRFGTVMSHLGNIRSDDRNFIAISAPFSDEGAGAVYIFAIDKNGIVDQNFESIKPSKFDYFGPPVLGFGLGLSNGLDIDNNTHNDFAVGAYKSGQVFIFKSYNFYKVGIELSSNTTTIFTTTTNFVVKHCVKPTPANGVLINNDTLISQLLFDDSRISYNSKNITKHVLTGDSPCWFYKVQFKKDLFNMDPVKIEASAKFLTTEDYFSKVLYIPFSRGCRNNGTCTSDLSLSVATGQPLLLGDSKEVELVLTVENQGDLALRVDCNLTVPYFITIINSKDCNDGITINNTVVYNCAITDELVSNKTKSFRLDVRNLMNDIKFVEISIEVRSLEYDPDLSNNKKTIKIPVLIENHPFLYSKSIPEGVTYLDDNKKLNEKFSGTHVYHISNDGPSPIEVTLVLLIPTLKFEDANIIEITKVEGNIFSKIVECRQRPPTINQLLNWHRIKLSNNEEIDWISCNENPHNCTEFYCYGGYLYKTSESISFSIDFTLDLNLLEKLHLDRYLKETIAFSSLGILSNGSQLFHSSAVSLIYGLSINKPRPVWVMILSIMAGILVLALVFYGLYKCNFFQRQYKHRLLTEQQLQSTSEMLIEQSDDEWVDL